MRVVQHDAVEVLKAMIPDVSLAGFHIFFPDPWPKEAPQAPPDPARIRETARAETRPGGYLHLATDWEDYATQMLDVLSAEPMLQNSAKDFAPPARLPGHHLVRAKGRAKGHGVWTVFHRR